MEGKDYCLKVICDDPRFQYSYEQAYFNYSKFKKTVSYDSGLFVDVVDTWRKESGEFCILMEYLDGWTRLEYCQKDKRILLAESALMQQGYFMIDFAPINFMAKGTKLKMIDMDTLALINDFPVDPQYPIAELSWYGSRILKEKTGAERHV